MPPPPEISVVIPLFNAEKYIQTCINSVLGQSFQNFEVIVIDDCSMDRSAEIVESYQDPRIKIFKQIKNSGESSSRNLGLKIARGKYIYFMDDDDAILPKTLEIFFNSAEESQAEVVYMNSFCESNSDFSSISQVNYSMPRFLNGDLVNRLQEEYIEFGVYVSPWIKIQRRDFILKNQIYFPTTTLNGDTLFNLAELCFSCKMQVIDACGYIHRSHDKNTMGESAKHLLTQAIHSMPIALDFVQQIFKSPNLISPLNDEVKMRIEAEIITRYLKVYALRSYYGELAMKNIQSTLNEILRKPELFSPNFMRVLINALAVEMIKTERLAQ